MDVDLTTEPLGEASDGSPVFLRDVWPSQQEVNEVIQSSIRSEMFRREYGDVFTGDERWRDLEVPSGERFAWDEDSTYVRRPPFFDDLPRTPEDPGDIVEARVLAVLGDSVTTDHISPAGAIAASSPAAQYLDGNEVPRSQYNTYGSRRGNHQVMMRGTFANVRFRNRLVEREGGWTLHLPDGEEMLLWDAAERYREEGVPLILLAGKEYGSGSSRDWAAKGPALQGVRAVIAESYERIHRSNLIGMGIVPLEYLDGDSAESLGLTGRERYDVEGIAGGVTPQQEMTVRVVPDAGDERTFTVRCRIDTPLEAEYYRHGGILQYVLRQLAES
jgi:aconitate hydratase